MTEKFPYHIYYLGDDALLIDFGNVINLELNQYLVQVSDYIKKLTLDYIYEIVVTYSTISIYIQKINHSMEQVKLEIEKIITNFTYIKVSQLKQLIKIPVCYEHQFAPDLEMLVQKNQISKEEIINLHCAKKYQVYMIGFLPGFAYMGEVDKKIECGRKSTPQLIMPGSVGIAGKQTGIYPLQSPGGWNIIGRTPISVFQTEKDPPCFLQAGDTVQFYPISVDEFNNY